MFSGPLLLILMAHEMGHYIVCLRRGVDATLPYFLPSPTLFGTLGAFIRIKTPIYTRRDLFDIGSAGPFAGVLMLLPFWSVGVWASHPLARGGDEGAILIGTPLACARSNGYISAQPVRATSCCTLWLPRRWRACS